jgi:hypothetical protein
MKEIASIEQISGRIYFTRGHRVMLDRDLAELYGVETKRLKEQVRRNIERFPDDFMFELTKCEFEILRSQFASSSWGGLRYAPMAFTEHGVLMISETTLRNINTELLEPKHRLVYSFRIDRKYRALFICLPGEEIEIIAITKHYRK